MFGKGGDFDDNYFGGGGATQSRDNELDQQLLSNPKKKGTQYSRPQGLLNSEQDRMQLLADQLNLGTSDNEGGGIT